jgi:glycosyltransferase involved in cell wall biosynthesis
MYVLQKTSLDQDVIAFAPPADLRHRIRRRIRRDRMTARLRTATRTRPDGYEMFSTDRSQHTAGIFEQMPSCDVINLHFIAGFIDYELFFSTVPRRCPVVWTLDDMNPLTGGCHYDDGCGRFVEGCGSCPQLGSSNDRDLSAHVWQRKNRMLARVPRERIHIVSPSRWLAEEANRSGPLHRFSASVIPYGLDTERYSPIDTVTARIALGIAEDADVLLFVSDSTTNRRKGFQHLIDAATRLQTTNPNLFLLSVGSGRPQLDGLHNHLHLGTIESHRILAIAYSAADLFVMPSLQEALGQTILEAMACGTPTVGFAVGGIPDIVQSDVTGQLVPVGDTRALGLAIEALLGDRQKRAFLSVNCRRSAVEQYSLEMQAERYVEVYRSLVT